MRERRMGWGIWSRGRKLPERFHLEELVHWVATVARKTCQDHTTQNISTALDLFTAHCLRCKEI